jgi:hypothetical protein
MNPARMVVKFFSRMRDMGWIFLVFLTVVFSDPITEEDDY